MCIVYLNKSNYNNYAPYCVNFRVIVRAMKLLLIIIIITMWVLLMV